MRLFHMCYVECALCVCVVQRQQGLSCTELHWAAVAAPKWLSIILILSFSTEAINLDIYLRPCPLRPGVSTQVLHEGSFLKIFPLWDR